MWNLYCTAAEGLKHIHDGVRLTYYTDGNCQSKHGYTCCYQYNHPLPECYFSCQKRNVFLYVHSEIAIVSGQLLKQVGKNLATG